MVDKWASARRMATDREDKRPTRLRADTLAGLIHQHL
jgi:hypothetical protein